MAVNSANYYLMLLIGFKGIFSVRSLIPNVLGFFSCNCSLLLLYFGISVVWFSLACLD